jgi:hypothetical protein
LITLYESGALSLALVFVVLLLSTGNWVVSAFSLMTILLIVVNILGVFRWGQDWELGIVCYIIDI